MKAYEEQYKGYSIAIHHDENARDPYEDDEGMYPMIVEGGADLNSHDYYDLENTLIAAMREMGTDQLRTMAAKLDGGQDAVTDAEENEAHHRQDTDTQEHRDQSLRSYLCDALEDLIGDNAGRRKLEALEVVADELGYPCLKATSRGYCQGDWADVLVVWTPEMEKRTGLTKKMATEESMKANVKYWGAWAWGDVFGYTMHDGKGNQVDSCWGFHEPDGVNEDSDVVQEARAAADSAEHNATLKRQQKLKAQIRAKAPLEYRQQA